jgi:hypothetical protein
MCKKYIAGVCQNTVKNPNSVWGSCDTVIVCGLLAVMYPAPAFVTLEIPS